MTAQHQSVVRGGSGSPCAVGAGCATHPNLGVQAFPIARGFRNFEHYRLRMLLIAGGFEASPHTRLRRVHKAIHALSNV